MPDPPFVQQLRLASGYRLLVLQAGVFVTPQDKSEVTPPPWHTRNPTCAEVTPEIANPRHSGVQKPRFQSCFGLHTAVPSRFPVQTKVNTSQNHLHWLPCRDRALGRDTALLILASYISRYASPEVWWLFHRITDQCLQFASVYAKPQCKCCL